MTIIQFPPDRAALPDEGAAPDRTHYYEPKERPIPRPTAWAIDCPCCNKPIEYLPADDEGRTFFLNAEEWPACHECQLILEPEAVELRTQATKRSPPLTTDDIAHDYL